MDDPADAPPDRMASSSYGLDRLIRALEDATRELKQLTSILNGMAHVQHVHHAAIMHELTELRAVTRNAGRPPWASEEVYSGTSGPF